ncbi:hypothetical protein O181_057507 [Austropuccinia psidii MF-1]|uniref:Uncharacterized protein n=1 Tax=Austropuccinia psidii MF-1 TaxID=1389203 RepID=A0A9Q3ECW7_9BASI|nr:hypothetical protein [Austropuccinia psidii MF-1]
METEFVSSKLNAEKDRALPWIFQQKDRLTALYPYMLEFMIHKKILRQCGGYFEHAVKIRTTKQSSVHDIINRLEEATTRTKINYSRINIKKSFNTPWKDSMDKIYKGNCNNMKHESSDTIIK